MQILKILDDLFHQLHRLLEQFHPDIYISSCLSLIISYNFNNINYDNMFSYSINYFSHSFGVLLIPIFSLFFTIQYVLINNVYQLLSKNYISTNSYNILFLQKSKH